MLNIDDVNYTEFINLTWFNSLDDEWQNILKNKYKVYEQYVKYNFNKNIVIGFYEFIYGIQKLDLERKNLKNLQGIKYCVNLKQLNCNLNSITSLEGLENCINLEYLDISGNPLTSLKGIENLINLKELNCNHNLINTLQHLRHNFNLKKLYCINNSITSLKGLENCYKLEELYCYNNNIDLNKLVYLINPIIGCSNLEFLSFQEVTYKNNNILKELNLQRVFKNLKLS